MTPDQRPLPGPGLARPAAAVPGPPAVRSPGRPPAGPPVPGPPPEPTAAIDRALAGLDGLADLPVAEHVERFDAVHAALTAALTSIDKV